MGSGHGRLVIDCGIDLVGVLDCDRAELERGLYTQGYAAERSKQLAWSIGSNDGALQMLARHRLATDASTYRAKIAELEGERDRLRVLAEKVNTIRNSIVGVQTFNWSEHAYPLVAALNEAGYPGQSYKDARDNMGTLIERTNAAEQRAERLVDHLGWALEHVSTDHPHYAEALALVEAMEPAALTPEAKGDAA